MALSQCEGKMGSYELKVRKGTTAVLQRGEILTASIVCCSGPCSVSVIIDRIDVLFFRAGLFLFANKMECD